MSHDMDQRYGPLRRPEQEIRVDEYIAPIMRDPATAVEQLRKLNDGASSAKRNGELYRWADRFNIALQSDTLMEEDIWRKFIRADVTNVCLDIIMRADFWQDDSVLRYALLESTSSIVRYAMRHNDQDTTGVLLSRATALWRSVWENKARGSFSPLRTQQDITANHPERIVHLLSVYGSLYYMHHRKHPPPDTYMPHVALHAWIVYGDSSPVNDISLSTSSLLKMGHERDSDVYHEVITSPSGVGAEAVVMRMKREFARAESPGTIVKFMTIYINIAQFHDALPAIERHSLVSEASATMNRLRYGPGTVREKILYLSIVIALFDSIDSSARRHLSASHAPQAVGLRGEDLIDILANGVGLLAEEDGTGFNGGTNMLIHTALSRSMDDWSKFYGKRRTQEGAQEKRPRHEQVFCESMKSRARTVWWPSLREAQDAKCRIGQRNVAQIAALTDRWATFGRALGLDASKERARHAKEALGRCAWRDCQYHSSPTGAVLLSCKGCGEVRYCGRDCQKHDWSKGGHKARCGRRLN